MKRKPKDTMQSCPQCETGRLLERKGKYGVFVGCSNYPKCAYIKKDAVKMDAHEQQVRDFLKSKGALKKEFEL